MDILRLISFCPEDANCPMCFYDRASVEEQHYALDWRSEITSKAEASIKAIERIAEVALDSNIQVSTAENEALKKELRSLTAKSEAIAKASEKMEADLTLARKRIEQVEQKEKDLQEIHHRYSQMK